MKKLILIIAVAAVSLPLTGCATYILRVGCWDDHWDPDSKVMSIVYQATVADGAFIAFALFVPSDNRLLSVPLPLKPVVVLAGLIDLPFSIVSDTIFLPVDLYSARWRRKEREEREAQAGQAVPPDAAPPPEMKR